MAPTVPSIYTDYAGRLLQVRSLGELDALLGEIYRLGQKEPDSPMFQGPLPETWNVLVYMKLERLVLCR